MGPYTWSYLGSALRIGAQFAISISLARLLGPEPFGAVAAAYILTSLVQVVGDLGVCNALIRAGPVQPGEPQAALLLHLLVSSLCAGLFAVTASSWSVWLGVPSLATVLPWMALTLPIAAIGQCSNALLRRDLAFRDVQAISLVGVLVGQAAIAIPLAWAGYGVWSLVVGAAGQATVIALLNQWRRPVLPSRPRLPRATLRTGLSLAGANLVNWLTANLDSAVIARNLGAAPLGEYNRFQYLTFNVAGTALAPMQSVLFPDAARRADDHAAVLIQVRDAGLTLILLGAPGVGCLVMSPATVIEATYGTAWTQHSAALAWLAGAALLMCLGGLSGPILNALGRSWREFTIQAACAMVALGAFAWAWQAGLGLVGIAGITCSLWMLRMLVGLLCVEYSLGARPGRLLGRLLLPALLGLSCAVPACLLIVALPDWGALARIVSAALLAYGCWGICLLALPRLLAPIWMQRRLGWA